MSRGEYHPRLFKKTNTGAIEEWTIFTNDNVIHTSWGQEGGALQVTSETIFGKNTGKANATTPVQQAAKEAAARWTKQLKKGYCTTREAAAAGDTDAIIEGGLKPMLAPSQIYPIHAKHLTWPVFVQPKLDGQRCVAIVKPNGDVTLWTRTRKRILSCPHIEKSLREWLCDRGNLQHETVLDGELYADKFSADFEGLMSLVRKQEPSPGVEQVEFHVYDLIRPLPQVDRLVQLNMMFKFLGIPPNVREVQTYVAFDDAKVRSVHEKNLAAGYEGSMLRSHDGKYEGGKRSFFLQKLKDMVDAEFEILWVNEGVGKDEGTVGSFQCKIGDKDFAARLKTTWERRRELFLHPEQWRGKMLTVKYQNLTSDGLPRFPIGKGLRDKDGA